MRKNNAYLNCLPRQEAQELWRNKVVKSSFFHSFTEEMIAVATASRRVVARSIHARRSVPHYNSAAMDGIALQAKETYQAQETNPVRFTLLMRGEPYVAGGCYVVDTGEELPAGTNAVVMIEDVCICGQQAEIIAAVAPWQHVRIIGEDIVANEVVIPEHRAVTPVDIAALLAAGVEEIPVLRFPRVAIIPTGDEIVSASSELQSGKILDVNSHMLAAAIEEWGGEAVRWPIVKDDRQALSHAVFASLQTCDMVVLNAGTSAGTEDFTAEVLGEFGEVLVHGVAIKPGKPVVLAICQGKPVIGLPGYPVSAMLTAEMFIRDILYERQRRPRPESATVTASLARQVASQIGVEEYVRVTVGEVQGRFVAAPLGRGAGLLSSLTKAQGIVCIDANRAGLEAGETLEVTLLRTERPETTLLAVGSHDPALELLGVFLKRRNAAVELACANVGSIGGLLAMRNNEAHLAGIHLLNQETGQYNLSYVQKYLGNQRELVHFAMRQQGLLVAPENPKQIAGLQDLIRPEVVFVNRQRGSGTRMLLDYELFRRGINQIDINGYDKEVGTHMAVAAAVASGTVDAGLGVQAAAHALGLNFIPVAQEQYDLLLNFTSKEEELREHILAVLRSAGFRQAVESLGGYDLSRAGMVINFGNLREI